MRTTDYQPIDCDLHSTYELLAMRRSRVCLTVIAPEGDERMLWGRAMDVYTRDGAEYLDLVTDAGERVAYRLDRLRVVREEAGRQIAD